MTRSLLASGAAIWALVLLPVLCIGGVLHHHCHEVRDSCSCEHDQHCDDEQECCGDVSLPDTHAPSARPLGQLLTVLPAYLSPELPVRHAAPAICEVRPSQIRKGDAFPQGSLPLLI